MKRSASVRVSTLASERSVASPDQRDVVLLRDVQGRSVADIAAQLGRTEKSVAGLLLRGRGRLRQLLPDVR